MGADPISVQMAKEVSSVTDQESELHRKALTAQNKGTLLH